MPRPTERQLLTLSAIANLIADGAVTRRSEIAARTGLSRSTTASYVDMLIGAGLAAEAAPTPAAAAEPGRAPATSARVPAQAPAARGRPALGLHLAGPGRLVCAIDLGARHCSIELSEMNGTVLAEATHGVDLAAGPARVLGRAHGVIQSMLRRARRRSGDIAAISIGVPGPVEAATGALVRPPIMPGWDGYRVPEFFHPKYGAAVLVDNDVNVMAAGELTAHRDARHLLFVKVGTGIGCGIVSDGALHRGASGAAGDIGHVRVPGHDCVVCYCGNTGCLEAVASGDAIAATLRAAGLPARDASDVVRLVAEGNTAARHQVRQAGQRIGEVLASLVSFHNPDLVVVGGALAALHEDLLADIRGVVYRRALPLATRSLIIEAATLGPRAGTAGARRAAVRHLLSPAGLAAAWA